MSKRLLSEIVIDVEVQEKRNKSSSSWRRIQESPNMKDWATIWKSVSTDLKDWILDLKDCKSILANYNEKAKKILYFLYMYGSDLKCNGYLENL